MWWEAVDLDWNTGDARRALQVLMHAYDTRPAIEEITRAASVPWAGAPPTGASAEELWRWVLGRAARIGLLYNVLATALADPGVTPFHAKLEALIGAERLEEAAELQVVADAVIGLRDPRDVEAICANGRRRTALIEVDGIASGTGFLIGPDLLLTAAHVIHLDCPPAATIRIVAVFDLLAGSGAPAQCGVRVEAKWLAGSPATSAEIAGRYQNWDAQADRLDYAVLRLERAVGNEPVPGETLAVVRGSYVVDDSEYNFQRAGQLTIHQHPLGGAQLVTTVRGTYQVSPSGTRVRYNGNTLRGSSGSACVDEHGRLVALHHFSTPKQNQGVPTYLIARHLIATNHHDLLVGGSPRPGNGNGPSPFSTLSFGRKPFVNRENLRETVKSMFGHTSRILVIQGGSRVGKSYSFQLLSYLAAQWQASAELQTFAPHGVRAHKLDLEEYGRVPTDGVRHLLIDAVVSMLGLVPPGWDSHAQAARTFLNLSSWLPRQLRDKGILHWLFIDNVDRFAIERDGMKELLVGLANLIEEDYTIPLRIVLVVGEKLHLQSELATWATVDSLGSLKREEAERWLRDSLLAQGISVDNEKIATRIAALHPGTPAPNPGTLAVALAETFQEFVKEAG